MYKYIYISKLYLALLCGVADSVERQERVVELLWAHLL